MTYTDEFMNEKTLQELLYMYFRIIECNI